MFLRAQDIESGSVFEHDLVIIGSGAAGITVAREFNNIANVSVAVIEAGGLSFSINSQNRYRGDVGGTVLHSQHPYLIATRLRYFGGTTNHWHGWCGKLDPIDFQKREWIPHSGWPIVRKDLDPYYSRALPIVEVDGIDTPTEQLVDPERPLLLASSETVRTRVFHRSPPTRFGKKYREELEHSKNVHVYLTSTVTHLVPDHEGTSIHELEIRRGQKTWRIRGKRVVLAAGGIENPRLLLASRALSPNGLGNENDLVGRYFMDHVQISDIGEVLLSNNRLNAHLYERFVHPKFKHLIVGTSALTDQMQIRQRVSNCSIFYMPASKPNQEISGAIQRAAVRFDTHEAVRSDGTHFGRIECRAEQIPNPNSRVTLSTEIDDLGMPKVKLFWELKQGDRESVHKTLAVLAREFGAHAEGRLRILLDPARAWNQKKTQGGAHHIGTTRMGNTPKEGVVDANCRVHSLQNLYVAGSSVFPTSGAMNPTLTIVALAVRLADHLKQKMRL